MIVSRINSEGSQAIVSKGLIEYVPVTSKPGTVVLAGDQIMWEFRSTIRDADVRVLLCAIKAYSDNHFEIIQDSQGDDPAIYGATEVATVHLDVLQLSKLAYDQRARPRRLLEAMRRWMDVKMHLMHNGQSRGCISICSGVALSKDRKTIEIGVNKRLIVDLANKMMTYNFDTMLKLKGISQRLYLHMQTHKHMIKRGRSGYHGVDDNKLRAALSLDRDENAKQKIEKAFKDTGIDFRLHPNGKWDWSNKKIRV